MAEILQSNSCGLMQWFELYDCEQRHGF